MRRAASLAAALLLPALAGGCTLDSDPAADSLGRARAAAATPAADAISLGPKVDGASTIEFFAPVETEYQVSVLRVDAGAVQAGPFVPPTVKPGIVNISLTSEGNHNLALAGPGLPVALLWGDLAGKPEHDLTHSVRLRAGTYTYYCSVPGHRNAGMQGTFQVGSSPALPEPTASA